MHGRKPVISIAMLVVASLLVAATSVPVAAQVVVDTIDLGEAGGGIAVNPNTHRVYVAVKGQIEVYDAQTHALLTTIPLPQNYTACYGVAVNTATNRIYAVGFRTYVIDGNANTVLHNFDKAGREVVVNSATNRVYVGGMVTYPYTDPYAVHVLDGESNTWLSDIDLGTLSSFEYAHVAANPTTNRVYIAFTGDNALRVLDGNTHGEVTRLQMEDIGHVAVNPNTSRVYVRTGYDGAAVLDGTSHAQVAELPRIEGRLRVDPQTNRIYGTARRSPGYILQVADGNTNSLLSYLFLDSDLEDYAVHSGMGKLYGTHGSPSSWARKMTVIQGASPTSPAPTRLPGVIGVLDLPADGGGVAVNTATNRLYVGVDGGLATFDATTLAPLPFLDLAEDSYSPPNYGVAVNESLNRIYAVGVGRTYVVDGANNQVLGQLGAGNEIAVNANNHRVYIGDNAVFKGDPDYLKIYDGQTLAHIRTIDLGVSDYFQSVHVAVNPTTGYAYCTYSLDGDLRIISPTTDDVAQTIDYSSSSYITVDPTRNRVFVQASGGGQSGVRILDGSTHAELGLITGIGSQLEMNSGANRLYGYTGYTLFQTADATSGVTLGRVFLDGKIKRYAVHPGLSRLYATHHDYPEHWARKVSVIQDEGGPPPPTPTPTVTPTPAPTRTRSPYELCLPLALRQ